MEFIFFILEKIETKRKYSVDRGFTLLEVLIAMGIISLLLVIIMTFFNAFLRGNTTQQVSSGAQQKARGSIEFVADDIKQAGLDPTGSGNFSFEVASNNEMKFTFDSSSDDDLNAATDFDGKVNIDPDKKAESITYQLLQDNGVGVLKRTINFSDPEEDIVVSSVDLEKSVFVYNDKDGNELASPVANRENIRSVSITIAIEEEGGGPKNKVSRELSSIIVCKNLYYNSKRN